MHLSLRQKNIGLLLVALLVLLVAARQFGWLAGEPRHKGKTVTDWLDSLVLYTNETRSNGDVFRVYRPPDQIVSDTAFQALQGIGSRAVPVLLERIAEPGEYPTEMSHWERWSTRWRWTWYRLRGPGKATRPTSGGWSPSQEARKTAAAFILVALGTNGQGGFCRLMETYAAAPRFSSVYGGKLAGAPVGFAPSSAVELACSVRPQLHDEIVAGVIQGLQHTNAICQLMAVDCSRVFPELQHVFIESRQKVK